MNKVYICSPYSGEVLKNVTKALAYCRNEILKGNLPVCPHIYFTRFLDDTKENERNIAIEMNKKLLQQCDYMNVYGNEISKGMQAEIDLAMSLNIPIKFVTLSDNDLNNILVGIPVIN